MDGTNQRRYARLTHRAKIRVIIEGGSRDILLDMKDFSEGGVYLLNPSGACPAVGEIVEVQTTELEDAPIQAAKVIHVEAGVGFGVEFILATSDADV